MANLRAGLIGLGMMGRHHARNLRSIDGVDLVAVADAAGDPHGVAGGLAVLPDVEALIEQGLDYVVVAAPTMYHEEIGLKLAEAGVHALIEKPLAQDRRGARALPGPSPTRGWSGPSATSSATTPPCRACASASRPGTSATSTRSSPGARAPSRPASPTSGVVKDLASHDIDLTAWVTQRKYELVAARTMFKAGREYEDMVAATCQLEGGLDVQPPGQLADPDQGALTIVTGEKGMFVADTLTADLTFYANGRSPRPGTTSRSSAASPRAT